MRRESRVAAAFCVSCLLAGGVHGAVFTVGTGGKHSTVQAALNAALATPGNDEVRLHTGTYPENLSVLLPPGSADEIDLRGGWNDGFSHASNNPASTVINGGGLGSVLEIEGRGGTLRLRGLTLRGGDGGSLGGGGVHAFLTAGQLQIENCHIRNNRAHSGGGLLIDAEGSSLFQLVNSLVTANRAESDNPAGGGLWLVGLDSARISVEGTRITQNIARSSTNQRTGGGFFVQLLGTAQGTLQDNEVSNNRLDGGGVGLGTGGVLWLRDGARAEARRNRLLGNLDTAANNFAEVLGLSTVGSSRLWLSDSAVNSGAPNRGAGVSAFAYGTSRLWLTNLTVVDSGRSGLLARESDSAALTIFNTLIFGHATHLDVLANVGVGNNLIGVDPKFVDRAHRNYRLKAGSPAGNKGRNNPPGGLGRADLDRKERIKGPRVDIGAYESL